MGSTVTTDWLLYLERRVDRQNFDRSGSVFFHSASIGDVVFQQSFQRLGILQIQSRLRFRVGPVQHSLSLTFHRQQLWWFLRDQSTLQGHDLFNIFLGIEAQRRVELLVDHLHVKMINNSMKIYLSSSLRTGWSLKSWNCLAFVRIKRGISSDTRATSTTA